MTSSHPLHPQSSIDRAQPETYRTTYDWASSVPLSTEILTLVSRAADVDPLEIEPLNDCVDPDALNRLFEPRQDGTLRTGGALSFTIHDHEVTVHADGELVVTPL